MIPSKKHLLRLGLISIAAITVGAVVGLALNYRTIKEIREGPRSLPDSPSLFEKRKEEKEEEKIATYSGTIKPAGKLYPPATHYLEDENGEMILLLESPKIDLGLIEGWEVEVEGVISEAKIGEQMIMEVEEVRL